MKKKVFAGEQCRFCEGILYKKSITPHPNSEKWRKKAYHFGSCLKCSKCNQLFMINDTKYTTEEFEKSKKKSTLF